MADRNDSSLATIGAVQLGLTALVLILTFVGVRALDVADSHQQVNSEKFTSRLDAQTQLLRDLTNEVRRLQDQQRTAQPVYLPQYGPPAQPQTGPAQPSTANPAAAPESPTHQGPGEGTASAAELGTSSDVPHPDPNAVIGGSLVETMAEPSTLNYYTTSEGATRQVMMYVLETLFTVSEQDPTKLDPMLAESWEMSDDKLTYTYHLRRGVTWSDGAPFTADDVLFTYAVIQDKAVKAESARGAYVDVESVKKIDDYTVQVKFKQLYWKSLYVFGNSLWIIPKHWYEQKVLETAKAKGYTPVSAVPGEEGFGRAFNEIRGPCVGTGPYVVPQGGWVPGESLTMNRNPSYWRLRVVPNIWNIETRRVRFISDDLAILNQVRQQKIDVKVVDLDTWQDSLSKEKVITDNYNFYTYDHIGLGFNYVMWNCRKFPFDDSRVRVAMTHLVDRAGMLSDLNRNDGTIATCPNKRIYPEYNTKLEPHPFDPQKAVALLKEAGFTDNDGDGVLEKQVDGQWRRLEFTLKVPSGRAEYERIGNKMQEAMARVGVKMDVKPLEWAVFIQQLDERNFDAVCLYSSFSDVWIDTYEDFHSSEDIPRGGNASGFHTPELDKLLAAARQEFDREKRIPMYHEIYRIVHEQQPLTLLFHGQVHVLAHKRFRNVIVRHKGMRSTFWWVDPKSPIQ
jgi:peptide/nickel transport system substrate-binding protein